MTGSELTQTADRRSDGAQRDRALADAEALPTGILSRISHMVGRRIAYRTAEIAASQPILSVTFDDFPRSAGMEGARILEAHGARGTFYVASGLFGRNTGEWTVAEATVVQDLAARGHEIGLHGHSHRPAPTMRPDTFMADLDANRAALRGLVPGLANESYAYPYGLCGFRHKRLLSGAVRTSRSIMPGINRGTTDLDFIRSVELSERSFAAKPMAAWLDQLLQHGGWLVTFTHDVRPDPSPYGTTPAVLDQLVGEATARGVAVMPLAAALDRFGIA